MLGHLGKKIRLATVAVSVVGIGALMLSTSSARVTAGEQGGGYLALGDSVTFGFIFQAGFEYLNPDNFVGYPAYVGEDLGTKVVNAACPGQTTSSFISTSGADNGCTTFRTSAPLHVTYGGSQLAFATSYLNSHRDTKLVSLQLGANDAFLLEKSCNNVPACILAGLPAVLATVTANLDTILDALKATHFEGTIVVLNYYSLDYTDVLGTQLVAALNQAIGAAAKDDGATVADVFTAFKTASATSFAGGHTCKAGLLNASPPNQFLCDVHPSQSGQQLIGLTVEEAFDNASE
jgi:lysophospholipase L1-like esterase